MTTETTSGMGASGVREETREVAGTAQERAGGVAQTAREQAGGVAQTARDQAGDVVAHTQAEARDLIHELRTSLRQQTQAQRERMAEVLGGFERELQQMVDQGGGSGPATEAVRQLTQRLRSWRQYLEGDGDMAGDLRSFARRRPGTFLLAAAAAGVVAGRMTRAARSREDAGDGSTAYGTPGYPTPGYGTPGYGTAGYGTAGATTGYGSTEYGTAGATEYGTTGYAGTAGSTAGAYPPPVTSDYPQTGEGFAAPAPSTSGPLPTDPSTGRGPTGRGGAG